MKKNNLILTDAEVSILTAMIHSKRACEEVLSFLTIDDFNSAAHKLIFKAIEILYNERKVIDLRTLTDMLIRQNSLEEIGGVVYLTEIVESYISDAHLEDYLNIISERTTMRNLQVAIKTIDKNIKSGDTILNIISSAEKQILNVVKNRNKNEFKSVKDVVPTIIKKLELLESSDNRLTGTETGFFELNKITGGFQNGDLIILAARPSMGKTALALNFSLKAAQTHKDCAIIIFSLEMTTEQLLLRILGSQASIESMKIRTGKDLTPKNWQDLTYAAEKIKKNNIFIDDSPGLKMIELSSKLRKIARKYEVKLVVIDYLQLLVGGDGENRQQEVSNISRQLKSLARELELPIVCLSQLSRKVEMREDKRPMMSDLRESGAIEQDADVIMFLYREDYYEKKEINAEADSSQKSQLIISKHRNGPTGTIELLFMQKFGEFRDYKK